MAIMLSAGLAAQTTSAGSSGVRMIGQSDGQQIKLRWAPTDWVLWESLRTAGVYLERQTIVRDGKVLPAAERLVRTRLMDTLLLPAGPGVFAVLADKDQYAAVAGQAFYGKTFNTDGGKPGASSMLSQSREIDDRYSFGLLAADQSFEVALLMGVAWTDTTINPRDTYLYRLRSADPAIRMDTIRMGYVSVDAGIVTVPPKITDLRADFTDRLAMLQWPLWPASDHYTSYNIERSLDGLDWEQRNEHTFLPIIQNPDQEFAFYPDSLEANGRPYFYRIIGRTPFGTDGPPSDVIQGAGIPTAGAMAPFIRSVTRDATGGLILEWRVQGALTQVQSLEVLRAKKALGPYAPISVSLPAATTSFTDPQPLATNYYKVLATDRYGRTEESYSALGMPIDSIPPAAPENVRGVILKDGRVVLTWDENTEPDLSGYRVYLSNKADQEFSLVSPRSEPGNYYVGQTTLNTLSRQLYAKVVAQDFHQNNSEFSQFATLERPDTIPPTTPLFTAVVADSNGVTLAWAASESVDLDRHALYQRELGTEAWTLVRDFPYPKFGSQKEFLVEGLEPDQEMEFRLDAVDRAGLMAPSEVVSSVRIGSPLRRSVDKVIATADRREKAVNLRWNYRADRGTLDYFLIYRSPVPMANDTVVPLPENIGRLFATDGADDQTSRRKKSDPAYLYRDPTPKMNAAYRYYVRAMYEDGAMSRLSPAAEVNY
jgi:hypothetical protein